MKIVKKYQNGYVDIIAENEKDTLYEKGDYLEVDNTDYKVFDYKYVDGVILYQAQKV